MPKSLTFESKHANRHVSQPLLSGVCRIALSVLLALRHPVRTHSFRDWPDQ